MKRKELPLVIVTTRDNQCHVMAGMHVVSGVQLLSCSLEAAPVDIHATLDKLPRYQPPTQKATLEVDNFQLSFMEKIDDVFKPRWWLSMRRWWRRHTKGAKICQSAEQ